jgi:hypothetical protein
MAFRFFKGIAYPVPGVDTAIQVLRPGARWDIENTTFIRWEDDEGREPPTWQEIEDEMIREVQIYNHYLYERNREKEYPDVKDQLDMLYHDIKSGNLENGSWIAAIDAVKENNPKPEGPEPII